MERIVRDVIVIAKSVDVYIFAEVLVSLGLVRIILVCSDSNRSGSRILLGRY